MTKNKGRSAIRCDKCRFWKKGNIDHGDGIFDGRCYRYPPIYLPIGEDKGDETSTDYDWPQTKGDDWCGEFQPKGEGRQLNERDTRKIEFAKEHLWLKKHHYVGMKARKTLQYLRVGINEEVVFTAAGHDKRTRERTQAIIEDYKKDPIT